MSKESIKAAKNIVNENIPKITTAILAVAF